MHTNNAPPTPPAPPPPHRRGIDYAMMIVLILLLGGCQTPPAVMPLLTVAQRAVADEMRQVESDAAREANHFDQTRAALKSAFEADLEAQEMLSPQWVNDATSVYVAAQEQLLAHEHQLAQQRRQRLRNLETAHDAHGRIRLLLMLQDRAIGRATGGLNLWNLSDLSPLRHEEPAR